MMIIVTGPDNAGKTTLVGELSKIMELPIVHSVGKAPKDIQTNWIIDQINNELDAIYERFPLFEEVVYGEIIPDRTPNFTHDSPLFSYLKGSNPIIIYVRPPMKNILNWGDREQMEGVKEHAQEMVESFDKLIRKLNREDWRVLIYDYTLDTPQLLVERIKSC